MVYIIGFVALWFHMNHGFWSMFQTCGWNNTTWLPRLKTIACWWTSVVVLLFIAQAITFTVQAHSKFFLTDNALQAQYAEFWSDKAEGLIEEFQAETAALDQTDMEAQITFFAEKGQSYADRAEAIAKYAETQAPDVKTPQLSQLSQFASFVSSQAKRAESMKQTQTPENNQ